jgi:hypothetical protein
MLMQEKTQRPCLSGKIKLLHYIGSRGDENKQNRKFVN